MGSPLKRSRLSQLLAIRGTCRKCDTLLCLADRNESNQEKTDQFVESIVCSAKATFPDLRIIALVLLPETKRAIECIDGWCARDTLLCVKEITQNMLAQNAMAPGAASIIATLMEAKNIRIKKCDDTLLNLFVRG